MCMSSRTLVIIAAVLLAFGPAFFNIGRQDNPKLLIISFDGFKHNNINKYGLKFLQQLKYNGTHTKYLKNVFETKTFPNHHSVATGLYPSSHGVLGQAVFDPLYQRVLVYGHELWHYNEEVVPLWIHNELSGNGRYSGVFMWPGSDFQYLNKFPTFVVKYNRSMPWIERVNVITSWFTHPLTPANLVMMYFEEPDFHAHRYGPHSPQVKDQLKKIDIIINYLINTFILHKLMNVNIVLLSDHGMVPVPSNNIINVTYLFPSPEECILTGSSPTLHVIPRKGNEETIYQSLKELSDKNDFKVYRKSELPEKWLYKDNRRIPPIMIIANKGYAFDDVRRYMPESPMYGLHGYDNQLDEMRPFFMAFGPRIKKNHTIEPFKIVDLFAIFCDILEIDTLPTNGTFENVEDMLTSTNESQRDMNASRTSLELNSNVTSE